MFAAIRVLDGADPAGAAADALTTLAETFSPRFELHGARVVVLDAGGLTRLFGAPEALGAEIERLATARGLRVGVAVAPTRVAALLVVQGLHLWRAGRSRPSAVAVVSPGEASRALAGLPLTLLETLSWSWMTPARPRRAGRRGHYRLAPAPRQLEAARVAPDPAGERESAGRAREGKTRAVTARLLTDEAVREALQTFRRWGLRTLGDVAALPTDRLRSRLGGTGVVLQRLARGEDDRPLVPLEPEPVFEAALRLEWPIEGLEPLSFVLGRVFDEACRRLEQHDRGAVAVTVRLRLVTRAIHERRFTLPAAMREARVLRMLAVLDLKSHPPQAGIDEVAVRLDPAPARIVRHSLLTRPLPSPEHVSTLMARLTALLGEGRCGSPVVVDTYRPGAFALEPFRPVDLPEPARPAPVVLSAVIRRFRVPIVVRVELSDGHPHRVWMGGQGTGGDRVRQWSGPWRSSGTWWGQGWDADEWDIELDDGSAYRASCSRQTGRWVIEGVLD